MEQSGKITRRRKTNFTAVSNCALQDKTLSYKAKGLYATISYYIGIPDFVLYKSFLMTLSTDGRDSFQKAWTELQTHGYLLVEKHTSKETGRFSYLYELLDDPTDADNDKNNNNEDAPTYGKTVYGKPAHGKTVSGETVNGKSEPINKNKENKTLKNNNLNNNKETINRFIFKISNVNQSEIIDVETKNERLNLFLKTLKPNELQTIDSLSKTDAATFYLAIMHVYDNPEIQNKEGYLRTILKNPISFIENFEIQTIKKDYVETYDDSNNPKATNEEYEALYKMRGLTI